MSYRRTFRSLFCLILCSVTWFSHVRAGEETAPQATMLKMGNRKSGISLLFSGTNGRDWAVEHTSHLQDIADSIVYLKPETKITLAHNQNNIYMHTDRPGRTVLGADGPDGKPLTEDDGKICYVIDRDYQTHRYVGKTKSFVIPYATPFTFAGATYDNTKKVVGTTGDNGGKPGSSPRRNHDYFIYGITGPFGNEWHTIKYWDDDSAIYALRGKDGRPQRVDKRAMASDGNFVTFCVSPKTPVIQFVAPKGEEFYTSPIKTYFVPKIWKQRTYLTGGVVLQLVNLTGAGEVQYRIGDGEWKAYQVPLVAENLFVDKNRIIRLESRIGEGGPVVVREVVIDPDYPGKEEQHGFMLWKDKKELEALRSKLKSIEPFKSSYQIFKGAYYQSYDQKKEPKGNVLRGPWRMSAGQCGACLSNAFVTAIETPSAVLNTAKMTKQRLLYIGRLHPVGFEAGVDSSSGATDFLSVLGQTTQAFAKYGLAYDMLAGIFRKSDHPAGMTPIEEITIRDQLGKCVMGLNQLRMDYSAVHGSGDTHWSHGYELAIGMIALAVPTYATCWYGASGGDFTTRNTFKDNEGKFFNPYPDQGVTWYECATRADITAPGYPNIRYPFRAEFIYTDDSYWSGPNDLAGDGNRYYKGPVRNMLVDLKYGGMRNADCVVELIEMSGYESPFVPLTYAFDLVRRIKNDRDRPLGVTNYINRRLVNGYIPLRWNKETKQYTRQTPVGSTSVWAYNRHYPAAVNAAPVRKYLVDLAAYYTKSTPLDPARKKQLNNSRKVLYSALSLALCDAPGNIQPTESEELKVKPFVKPLFKHVLTPGRSLKKEIIAGDLLGSAVEVTVTGMPAGCLYDKATRTITWTPGKEAGGVHIITVTAANAHGSIVRSFPVIVRVKPYITVPAPAEAKIRLSADGASAEMTWESPKADKRIKEVPPLAGYFVYRDGLLIHAVNEGTRSFVDKEYITPGQNTRYEVSAVSLDGSESTTTGTRPGIFHIPVKKEEKSE